MPRNIEVESLHRQLPSSWVEGLRKELHLHRKMDFPIRLNRARFELRAAEAVSIAGDLIILGTFFLTREPIYLGVALITAGYYAKRCYSRAELLDNLQNNWDELLDKDEEN